MSAMKQVVEDAEELGIEWEDRKLDEVLEDIALIRLGEAIGAIDVNVEVKT